MKKTASLNTKADRISGYVFVALGLLVVIGSAAMPDFSNLGASWYEAPGLTPGILGLALTVSGILLATRTQSPQPENGANDDMLDLIKDPISRRRIFATAGLCVFYASILIGLIPFWLATALFIFVFTFSFEYFADPDRSRVLRKLVIALLLGLTASAAVTLLFQELFLVRLP
ncbi:tripartite tricarboxylate transporter TctB family protein [Pseudovibrio sp. Tun.PSC04-5.I4]|uniref:tripartite tricarboxylate transporter TctB family protein n=1 Tax=Pseudovibrio sp. Tun.PSC04-5.I4 TaxID=1798213 RepID=UPI0008909784|nr:tripartite tricarboxylate transporter TctB family protein [Pseudovibrio sp. Tun.PSC04-5.I4]SDQ16972.1 Tripartite tricarboxylate transporter TctB family protein [Pseudovibrio sp. Tun.PSC04-5.I4]